MILHLRIAVLLLTLGCGGKPGDTATTVTSAPPPPSGETGTPTFPTTPTGDACAYAGQWELSRLTCDGIDVTADWQAVVDSTTLLVSDSPSGNCFVEVINAATYCEEREEYEAEPVSGDLWGVVSFGVTSCNPLACTFSKADAPCATGDRSGSWTEVVTLTSDLLVLERDDGLGPCVGFGATTSVVEFGRVK